MRGLFALVLFSCGGAIDPGPPVHTLSSLDESCRFRGFTPRAMLAQVPSRGTLTYAKSKLTTELAIEIEPGVATCDPVVWDDLGENLAEIRVDVRLVLRTDDGAFDEVMTGRVSADQWTQTKPFWTWAWGDPAMDPANRGNVSLRWNEDVRRPRGRLNDVANVVVGWWD